MLLHLSKESALPSTRGLQEMIRAKRAASIQSPSPGTQCANKHPRLLCAGLSRTLPKVGYETVERFGDLCDPSDFVAAEDVLMVETHNWIFAIMCSASRVKADWIITATIRPSKLNKAIGVRHLRDVPILKNCHAQFLGRLVTAIGEKVNT